MFIQKSQMEGNIPNVKQQARLSKLWAFESRIFLKAAFYNWIYQTTLIINSTAYSSNNFLFFLILGYLCNATDVAANATVSSHNFLSTPKVTQAPESETPPHKYDVPGLFFNLLLPPNRGSVLPSVCTLKTCEYTVPFFPCCFPPNDSFYPKALQKLQTQTNWAAI